MSRRGKKEKSSEVVSTADAADTPKPGCSFPIVGIGASAGGLDALKELFEAMPSDSGMAFVVIQHLSPTHESRMAEILAKSTALKVVEATDGTTVEPNTVYTNPPGNALSIRQGRLVLADPSKRGHVEAAINHFLLSLAEECGPGAICIILSGSTGTDGPRGVRAVRDAGGMCMAQEPGSAQFPAMPQTVIDNELADFVLRPSQMPASLVSFTQRTQILDADHKEPQRASPAPLEDILKLLRKRTKSDYTLYKHATISRRVERRMGIRQISSMDDYLKLLMEDPNEVTQLSKDMLIGVSSFFRDPDVFEELRNEVIVPLVQSRPNDEPIRAWVAGCASGEEAYTIAMLVLDALTSAGKTCPVKIFATDIEDRALATARTGVYELSMADSVPARLLETFFTKQPQAYKVNKPVRDTVVFSRQNLLSDPPFSKLDLISCRNVLIYLNADAQKKVLSIFGFALNTNGHLLLGKSEGVSGADVFELLSKRAHIYKLTRSSRGVSGHFSALAVNQPISAVDREHPAAEPPSTLAQANLEALLRHFNASVVLIDSESMILYFHGQTEKYLGHPKGVARLNLLTMIGAGNGGGIISAKLRKAISQALQKDEPVRLAQVALPQARTPVANLTVMRLGDRSGGDKLLAVIFEDAQPPPVVSQAATAEEAPLVAQLENEIKALGAELRTNADSYYSATEEIRAANEEMTAMNEELQSANEELESSQEELQSLNEELTTVNSQLNEKVSELTETNDDLTNVMAAIDMATLFLDSELRIRRFTPRATDLFSLLDSDMGRPISNITHRFTDADLTADMNNVIKTLVPLEKELQASDGRWYTLRILPYRTRDNRIAGVVVTFANVNRLKEAESHLLSERNYAELIIETMRHPLLVLDANLHVLTVNRAFSETFQMGEEPLRGRKIYDLGNRQWDIPHLRMLLEEIIPKDSVFDDFRVEHDFQHIGRKVMLISGRRIEAVDKIHPRLLLNIQDITSQESAEANLRDLTERLTRSNTELEQFAYLVSHDLQEPLRMVTAFLDMLGPVLNERLDEKQREKVSFVLDGAQRMQALIRDLLEFSRLGKDGTKRAMVDLATPLDIALQSLRIKIEQSGAKISHDLLPTVMADATQLARLFQNLLGNAIKFRGSEPPAIHIAASSCAEGWKISVRDNGIGIDMQFADRIFKVFERLKVSESYEGTGIGLAICKKIVEHHGGRIWLESEVGKGTTFYFTLPAGTADAR
jgi:two-component system CheB/CheR fusion protein